MDSHAITLHMARKVFHFLIPAVGAFLSVFHNRKHKKRHFHYAFLNIKEDAISEHNFHSSTQYMQWLLFP